MSYQEHYHRKVPDLYSEFPPEHFVSQYAGKTAQPYQAELERAQWFWDRQPKARLLTLHAISNMIVIYLVLFTPLIHATQPNLAWVGNLIIGAATLALLIMYSFLCVSKYNKWKYDYERAIARLVRRMNP
jgi:hypothetical protein